MSLPKLGACDCRQLLSLTRRSLVSRCLLGFVGASFGCVTPEVPSDPRPKRPLGEQARRFAVLCEGTSVAATLKGTFETLSVIAPRSERFTLIHRGDRIEMEPGLRVDADITLDATAEELDALASYLQDGVLGTHELTSLVAAVMGPLTRQALDVPPATGRLLRQLIDLEDRVHVVLVDHFGHFIHGQTIARHTGRWVVHEEVRGRSERLFLVTAEDALNYQRHAHRARTAGSPAAWRRFAVWFRRWRETVSVVPDRADAAFGLHHDR